MFLGVKRGFHDHKTKSHTHTHLREGSRSEYGSLTTKEARFDQKTLKIAQHTSPSTLTGDPVGVHMLSCSDIP